MEKKCTHKRPYYTVKRMRFLKYLQAHGFEPFESVPDPTNPKYLWWLFDNTPELEKCIETYFETIKKNK